MPMSTRTATLPITAPAIRPAEGPDEAPLLGALDGVEDVVVDCAVACEPDLAVALDVAVIDGFGERKEDAALLDELCRTNVGVAGCEGWNVTTAG